MVIDFIMLKISFVSVFISPLKIPNLVKFDSLLIFLWASLIAQLVKNLPAMQETPVQFLGQGFAGGGIGYPLQYSWASLVAQLVKNPPAM